jgi:hypothetical protein
VQNLFEPSQLLKKNRAAILLTQAAAKGYVEFVKQGSTPH